MAERGYIPGWDGNFHGDRPLSRYQLAFALNKLVENLHMLKKGGRIFTAEDISNLEALTIEFADELTLVNTKLKEIEADADDLREDIETVRSDVGPRGRTAPISGTIAARLVQTATSRPGYGQAALSPDGSTQDPSAATPPALRYHGDVSGPRESSASLHLQASDCRTDRQSP
jgi:hypothetical protein